MLNVRQHATNNHIMIKKTLQMLAITLVVAAVAGTPAITRAEDKPAAAPEAKAQQEKKKEGEPFKGKITAVDKTAKTITVESKKGSGVVVTVTEATKISKDTGAATFDDLVVGEQVRGHARKSGDKLEALVVRLGVKAEGEKPKGEKKAKKEAAQ